MIIDDNWFCLFNFNTNNPITSWQFVIYIIRWKLNKLADQLLTRVLFCLWLVGNPKLDGSKRSNSGLTEAKVIPEPPSKCVAAFLKTWRDIRQKKERKRHSYIIMAGGRLITLFSSSVGETRWNACRECGNSRGATGSQEPPSLGVFILISMCQLETADSRLYIHQK